MTTIKIQILETSPEKFKEQTNPVFVAFTATREWWDDLENDRSAAKSKLIDAAIKEVTTDKYTEGHK